MMDGAISCVDGSSPPSALCFRVSSRVRKCAILSYNLLWIVLWFGCLLYSLKKDGARSCLLFMEGRRKSSLGLIRYLSLYVAPMYGRSSSLGRGCVRRLAHMFYGVGDLEFSS